MASPRANVSLWRRSLFGGENQTAILVINGLTREIPYPKDGARAFTPQYLSSDSSSSEEPGNASATIRTDSSVALSENGLLVQTGDYTDQSPRCQAAATNERYFTRQNFRTVNPHINIWHAGRRKGRPL
jgi:hypothetical protein